MKPSYATLAILMFWSVSCLRQRGKWASRLQSKNVWGTFDRARFFPAQGHEAAMLHGKFCGSNVSARSGYELLAEITSVPAAGKWTELLFPNTKRYRWIRYEAPPGSYGIVAEMEFYFGKRRRQDAPSVPSVGEPGEPT